jgi:hypothetical protein
VFIVTVGRSARLFLTYLVGLLQCLHERTRLWLVVSYRTADGDRKQMWLSVVHQDNTWLADPPDGGGTSKLHDTLAGRLRHP